MELTVSEILHVNIAIDRILKSEMKIKFQTAYKLMKVKRELDGIEEYIAKRMAMVGIVPDNSDVVSESSAILQSEILRSVVDVDVEKISVDELSSDGNLLISLDEMEKLSPILS